MILKRAQESKLKQEREKALDIGLKLKFADIAESLKRVEVENPKAKILAVDDEAIVLDSFRKILVLGGYSVDTVESGPEALTLIQSNDYDFVFTDLKMPEMDGVEVTKAVRHLRPDIDVLMITGYATIESAVDVLKFGAMDYVQKPFSKNELVEFVDKSLIKRQDRIEKEMKPKVHPVTSDTKASAEKDECNIPMGIFISEKHVWSNIRANGAARIGVDEFIIKMGGRITNVILPKINDEVKQGEPIFSIVQGKREVSLKAPISGKVVDVNKRLLDSIYLVNNEPYDLGWIASVQASDLSSELNSLKIGQNAVSWFQEQIDDFMKLKKEFEKKSENTGKDEQNIKKIEYLDDALWEKFTERFL
jgi:CheY-like chemotaxis protein